MSVLCINQSCRQFFLMLLFLRFVLPFLPTFSFHSSFTSMWTLSHLYEHFLPRSGRIEKINPNFYFHTSLWCLKRFYAGLWGLHKTFCGTTKKCENKDLIFISMQLSEMPGAERIETITFYISHLVSTILHCDLY